VSPLRYISTKLRVRKGRPARTILFLHLAVGITFPVQRKPRHLHLVPRPVRAHHVYHRAAPKRNRHPQSTRSARLSLFGLLSKELFLLVILSMAIASPLAWYSMNNWLQSYAYRIDLTPWTFILAGTLVILIALATTGFQIIKAVVVNPVDTLRLE
jgi:sterol desaturase/sphingolipid hydroxylase (fatty acid hydroxylase superfamily)